MRPIKFRGKRLDNGEWIIGYYLEMELCDGCGRCSYIKADGYEPIKVNPNTIGQYTGLKDKNGEKVFEGDIIRYFYPENLFIDYTGVIKYQNGSFNFCHTDGDGMLRMRDFGKLATEVLGNIHDNPDLLK